MTVDPIHRPGLAYQHAFDWLAVQLHSTPGPVAALVPAAFHAAELLRRLPCISLLPPLPEHLTQVGTALGNHPVTPQPENNSFSAIGWVEPLSNDAGHLQLLAQGLEPGGRLYLIAGGPLSRFLTDRRQRNDADYLSAHRAQSLLKQHGFRVVQRLGVHGPRAIGWHYAGEAAYRLGRPAWRDRAHFAMRRDFVEPGAANQLAALVLITAKRCP